MATWTFYMLTFGCKVNQYETQSLREQWQLSGGVEADSPSRADIVLINSCAITAKAERDARNALYRIRRESPDCRIILTGCSALLVAERLEAGHHFDLLVPQAQKSELLKDPRSLLPPPHPRAQEHNTVQGLMPNTHTSSPSNNHYPPFSIKEYHRARPVLKITDGCEHRCTYCIVPLTRGKVSSRHPEDVIAEARHLLNVGYREIMISGINLRQYGRDNAELGNFWTLLRSLHNALEEEWGHTARLRISSLEPSQLDNQGLETLAACHMLCPHLHISLQSGSSKVLKRMGRGHYTAETLCHATKKLATFWPRFGLGADLIMGFPGETEEDVTETLNLINSLPFTYAHVFPYSPRPGTAAASFPQQIPHAEKQSRARQVREAIENKQKIFWHSLLAEPQMHIVLDTPDTGCNTLLKSVNEWYVPCLLDKMPSVVSPHALIPTRPVGVAEEAIMVTTAAKT